MGDVKNSRKDSPGPFNLHTQPQKRARWTVLGGLLTIALVFSGLNMLLVDQSSLTSSTDYAMCSASHDIYTVDESQPRVECVVVEGSRIVDTGSLMDVRNRWEDRRKSSLATMNRVPRGLKVINVKPGSVVVPGLTDPHAHLFDYGFKMHLTLEGSKSVDEVIDRLKSYLENHRDIRDDTNKWIEGMGWDQNEWPDTHFPTAKDLDRDPVLRRRLIALVRVDGHSAWVSPRVLELMGDIPDTVEGGEIVRHPNGKPTGVLIDKAMLLIPKPPLSEKQKQEYFDVAIRNALAHGLTSMHDAKASPEMIDFFRRKSEEGELPIRLYMMGYVDSMKYWGSEIPRLDHSGKHGRLTVRSVKIIADGALGSWGASMIEPYSDKPETSGIMLNSPEAISALARQFWREGWQVNIHCIGDNANKLVLDIYEQILEGEESANVTEWRPRIEHAQIMQLSDIERAGRLGVILSVQPAHAIIDMGYAESRLGMERLKGAYAFKSQLQASSINILPLGSDLPVVGINPLLGFYAAVSRLSVEGESPHGSGGWYPEQRLSRAQALKGMTYDPAYASFAEHELGTLTPGKKADFTILDRNIMTVPFSEILSTKVQATVVDGSIMYGSF